MQSITLNAVGEACPIPVVKATKTIRSMAEAGTLEVLVDNDVAVQNLNRMASGYHFAAQTEQRGEALWAVVIDVTGPVGPVTLKPETICRTVDISGNFVVAVDADIMGRGSDELGKVLMKGFLFAVGQLPELPRELLFYNGGARLTCTGSDSLEDLKAMADRGVSIRTCGTCLNYYGLTDALAVGSVTNMYEIVEALSGAEKVIKP